MQVHQIRVLKINPVFRQYTYERGHSISHNIAYMPSEDSDQLVRLSNLISLRCPPGDTLEYLLPTECPRAHILLVRNVLLGNKSFVYNRPPFLKGDNKMPVQNNATFKKTVANSLSK